MLCLWILDLSQVQEEELTVRVWCSRCGTHHEEEPIVGTFNDLPSAPCSVCGKPVRGSVPSDLPKCWHCGNKGKMAYIR